MEFTAILSFLRAHFRNNLYLNVFIIIGLLCCFSSGCARRELSEMRDQLQQLQDFEREFRKENFELSGTLNRNLKRLREQLDHMTKTIADVNAKLDSIAEVNRSSSGKIDELMHKQQQLQVPKLQPESESLGIVPKLEDVSSQEAVTADNLGEKLYRNAYNDFIKGNYELAIVGFKDYIAQNASSNMADNAQYWIGECYYTQGKYQDAIGAFEKVLNDYPNSDRIPPALLKKGYALLESGKSNEGKTTLTNLMRDYPTSEESKLAQERLKHLK